MIGLDIREHEVVIFDFSETVHVDDSAAMVIGRLLEVAAESETECIIMGLGNDVAVTLHSLDILGRVPADRMIATLNEARRIAREALEDKAKFGRGQ